MGVLGVRGCKMKVLVIGSGGREHAIVWKLAQSPRVKKIYCVPGNGGISQLATTEVLSVEDKEKLVAFAKSKGVDLTVVGPELPLSLGIVDAFEAASLRIFGPRKNASIIESSKSYTKELCFKYGIPTAGYQVFHQAKEARVYIDGRDRFPVVIKADGLAAGKGVIIARDKKEAFHAVDSMLVLEEFGEAGRRVIVEDFLEGEEATYMVVTDGNQFAVMESSQDHKAVFDHDQGPNTGGMGAYSPAPVVTKEVEEKIKDNIIRPLLEGMRREDRPYRGLLYAGLMIHQGEPRLVEFNCRFGDPEAQVILYRLKTDLVDLIDAVLEERIDSFQVEFDRNPAVCVVMTSQGYPGPYEKGYPIKGLQGVARMKGVYVFHAGTKENGGSFITNGGRVLAVTSTGRDLQSAIDNVYKAVHKISWVGVHYRTDIGQKGLNYCS